jgi:hypothetical protein
MKLIYQASLLLALCCFSAVSIPAQQGSETPLTNAAVIKLVRAGFKEKTIVAIIRSRPNNFNLDPDRLIELKRNGVGENIILVMLSQDDSFVPADDDWSDDSFFANPEKGQKQQSQSAPADGGVDIFGSSAGSKSQTKMRGGRGNNSGETTTTGSATVRIIRPPAESGGATAAKLERTPTLDNEAVIRLVEAGFSEGTIIKRIEDSPAEFDLSAGKLELLRKRRVSEPIITAMSAAMKDDETLKPSTPNN